VVFGSRGLRVDRNAALQVIRDCFVHIEVERIVVEHDPLVGGEVARVVVRDDQLGEALRNNGEHARRAAMQSGLDVEVVLASE
jgi:transcription antitermination factor NusA-like protein